MPNTDTGRTVKKPWWRGHCVEIAAAANRKFPNDEQVTATQVEQVLSVTDELHPNHVRTDQLFEKLSEEWPMIKCLIVIALFVVIPLAASYPICMWIDHHIVH